MYIVMLSLFGKLSVNVWRFESKHKQDTFVINVKAKTIPNLT